MNDFIRLVFYVLMLQALLYACVDPLEVNTEDEVLLLTVEGYISSEPGPHNFRLSRTAKYGSIFEDFPRRIIGAEIAIRDGAGNVTMLNEKEFGNYETPSSFRAVPGETYTLLIETAEGERFMSFPETAKPSIEIDTLIYQYEEKVGANPLTPVSGFKIFVQFRDNSADQNYYAFLNRGMYELDTRPDLFEVRGPDGQMIPAPKDCCFRCIHREVPDDQLILDDDRLTNGSFISKEVAFVEDNGLRYENKNYLFTSTIQSLTQEAFQYLSLMENQLSIDGDIFDPPPAQVRGNIINLDDPTEEVLGYFWVATIAKDSVFLDPSRLKDKKQKNVIQDDCRETNGATRNFPSWW